MKKTNLLLALLLGTPFVYLGIIWPQLPQHVPMHFSWNGTIDRYGNKKELLILTAILTLVIIIVYLLLTNIHRLNPRKAVAENKERMRKMALAIAVFMIGMQVWLIYIVQKGEIIFSFKFVFMALCLLLAVIGNYMPNLKPNHIAGFRLPWTLKNENNWRKTHHIAGRIWVGGGLLSAFLFLVLSYETAIVFFILLMLMMIFIPAVYSYTTFKNSK